MFDYRSHDERKLLYLEDERRFALAGKLSNWENRPEVFSKKWSKVVWKPSVHELDRIDQMLFIVAGRGENIFGEGYVDLILYESEIPCEEIKKFEVRMEHFQCGMIVNDKRASQDVPDDFLVAVLFDPNVHRTPCKLVKLDR